jgi:Rrf2 family protein
MKISQKSEYALRALFDLALRSADGLVKVSEIASRQAIPQKFLELILGNLRHGGFVETRRGREGGYRLARPAHQITVGEVLRFVESDGNAKRPSKDAFAEMWNEVDRSISTITHSTTFADVAGRWQKNQAEYLPNWQI